MAEIWVRKSLVGVITRILANEAFALVMALLHANAKTNHIAIYHDKINKTLNLCVD